MSQIAVRRPAPIPTPHHNWPNRSWRFRIPTIMGWGGIHEQPRHWWTCWRMPNFIKMLLLSSNRPMTIYNIGMLNRHVLLKRPLEHFMLQRLRCPKDSRSCLIYKKTMKLMSNWPLAKQFLSTGSSSLWPNKSADKGPWIQTNGPQTARPSLCPGVVIGRPCNSAFCETYSERGRFVGGGVQLPSWHCQYKKGCCHVWYPGSAFFL